ncbi:MAG: hypothetical protein ACXWDL_01290 [Nocardioides sp.]
MAIQVAPTPRPTAPKVRETGPRPLRTARGAGRLLLDRALRVREVELFDLGLAFDFDFEVDGREEDVLLFREPGGEDVRVAMLEG